MGSLSTWTFLCDGTWLRLIGTGLVALKGRFYFLSSTMQTSKPD